MTFSWVGQVCAMLLALGIGWSVWLGGHLLFTQATKRRRALAAAIFFALPLVLVGTAWYLLFFTW